MNKQQLTAKVQEDLRTKKEHEESNNRLLLLQELKDNPKFKELDSQVRNLTLDIAKANFAGKSTTALKKKLEPLAKQHSDQLKKFLPSSTLTKMNVEEEVTKLLFSQSDLPAMPKTSNPKKPFDNHPVELQKIYSQLEKYVEKFPNTAKQNII